MKSCSNLNILRLLRECGAAFDVVSGGELARALEAGADAGDIVFAGVGKTDIARRLAHLTGAPFIKVEASKFTEVGYVGRDVESMIRDLTDMAVELVKREKAAEVRCQAEQNTEERLLNLLLPPPSPATTPPKPAAGAALSRMAAALWPLWALWLLGLEAARSLGPAARQRDRDA